VRRASSFGAVTLTGWPQFMQNFAPEGSSAWQFEQRCTNAVPQLRQNLAAAGFSVWQLGHCMVDLPEGM
jgi:hypothetical protein